MATGSLPLISRSWNPSFGADRRWARWAKRQFLQGRFALCACAEQDNLRPRQGVLRQFLNCRRSFRCPVLRQTSFTALAAKDTFLLISEPLLPFGIVGLGYVRMAKTDHLELGNGEKFAILHEDRSVIALDKPRGWMLVPHSWQKTDRNLQAAVNSAIAARLFWARSRNLRYLRHVHRLDADTSGILLFAKSPGALRALSGLFESRYMEKIYLAVAQGAPKQSEWVCRLKLAPNPRQIGTMKVDPRHGKEAETRFRVLESRTQPEDERPSSSRASILIEARPITGPTHHIHVHLAESGHPIVGDKLYGPALATAKDRDSQLGLRAVSLFYLDPFSKRRVRIQAPSEEFVRGFGIDVPNGFGVDVPGCSRGSVGLK